MKSNSTPASSYRRVLLVTLHYQPEPNFITADLAEYMARHDHEVTVITAHPSYPLGKFYKPGNSWRPTRSLEGGVTVWRLPIIPDHSKSKYRRAAYYSSFMVMAFLLSLMLAWRKDLLIVYHTPFTTAMSVVWRRILGCRMVYLSSDLWPESFPASGIRLPSWLYKTMYAYSKFINLFASHIITSTDGIRQRYISDGISSNRVDFFPVWVGGLPDHVEFQPRVTEDTIFDVVYAGNLGPAQGLDTLIKAASKLSHVPGVRIRIFGAGASESDLKQQAARLNLNNVEFLGRVSPEVAFQQLNNAGAVFLHLNKTPLFRMTIPSKLASLLACNSLILCGAEGETNRLVQMHEAGLVFEPENPQALADVILNARDLSIEERSILIRKAKNLYNQSFSRKILLESYYRIIVSMKETKSELAQNSAMRGTQA